MCYNLKMKNVCKLKLNISNLVKDFKVEEKFFKEVAKKTLKLIDPGAGECVEGVLEVDLAFVSEEEIKKINKQWRGKNKPTDVLSFSEISAPQGRLARDFSLQKPAKNKKITKKHKGVAFDSGNLMQIIICPAYAKKQMKKFNLSFRQELAMLMAHGILHILGYDHERSRKEEDIIWGIQDKILKELK